MTFSRYKTSHNDEIEYQSGSRNRVLKNILGITSKREMDKAENAALIQTQTYFESRVSADTVITTSLIQDIHSQFLGKIYSWAGKYRSVDMSKGDYPFPRAILLFELMQDFEKETLRKLTPVSPASNQIVAEAMAKVHAEFLAIHPFREGNGRMARMIVNLMALQAAKPTPYYSFTGKGSKKKNKEYLNAVFEGYRNNYEPLSRFFEETLRLGADRWFTDFMDRTGRVNPVAPSNTLD